MLGSQWYVVNIPLLHRKQKKEGYKQIANIFLETANNEKEYAKLWYKPLHDGIADTMRNLHAADAGEHEEWTNMYTRFVAKAREEGFNRIVYLFEQVGIIEKYHEEPYLQLLKNIEEEHVFKRQDKGSLICLNYGHIHYGPKVPKAYPVCVYPQEYSEIAVKNY